MYPTLAALLLVCVNYLYEALKACVPEEALKERDTPRMRRLADRLPAARSALRALRSFLCMAMALGFALCVPLNRWQSLLAALGLSVVSHFVCALLPMRLARSRANKVFANAAFVYNALSVLLRPFTAANERLQRAMPQQHILSDEGIPEHVTENEIRAMMDLGEEKGDLEGDEHALLENVFDFGDLTAVDCMVHRVDMTAIWIGEDERVIYQLIESTGLSRYPVYDEDTDDIKGVLNTRDFLINLSKKPPEKRPVRKLLREAYFVPETVKADTLLKNMQRTKNHMALVVDEYGGISGLVTMEDLLEKIVGEIYDEYDEEEPAPDIQKVDDSTWRVDGSVTLEALGEALGVTVPESDDYDTLGGLFLSRFNEIPEDGTTPETTVWLTEDLEEPETGTAPRLRIRVEKLTDHRVESALVTLEQATAA